MLTDALPFPSTSPSSYEILRDEPVFNPRRHLALEPPSQVLTLYDFGYSEEEAQKCASQVAITGPFRLLSMEPTRDSIVGWGEPGIIAEFVRHKAWLSREKLDDLLRRIDVNELPTDILSKLADAIGDTEHAITVIDRSIQNNA